MVNLGEVASMIKTKAPDILVVDDDASSRSLLARPAMPKKASGAEEAACGRGSVSEQIVRKAGCAIVVARPKDHGNAPAVEVEAPCRDCISAQKAGEQWCTRHAERHVHGRLHYERPPTFGVGSTFLWPQG